MPRMLSASEIRTKTTIRLLRNVKHLSLAIKLSPLRNLDLRLLFS